MIQKQNKLMIFSMLAAAVSAVVCLIPPLIFLLFGASLISEMPAWLDYLIGTVSIIFIVIASVSWFRRKGALRQKY